MTMNERSTTHGLKTWKGEYFYSYITKRRYKVRQNINCKVSLKPV